jgi:hypothetical protein
LSFFHSYKERTNDDFDIDRIIDNITSANDDGIDRVVRIVQQLDNGTIDVHINIVINTITNTITNTFSDAAARTHAHAAVFSMLQCDIWHD